MSGDVRRGAVKIEVLVNKMRKQMEIDLIEYPDSRNLALELKRIYSELLAFSDKIDSLRGRTEEKQQSVWATATETPKTNVVDFKRANK